MRIFPASASAPVRRTLEQVIVSSGHSVATAQDCDLILADPKHPTKLPPTETETLTTPIAPRQLIRMLRSKQLTQALPLGAGWQLDLSTRTLTHATQEPIALTEKECALLAALAKVQPHTVTREALLADVWGMSAEIDTHTLETHIYRLRSKLGAASPAPAELLTEGGAYRLSL